MSGKKASHTVAAAIRCRAFPAVAAAAPEQAPVGTRRRFRRLSAAERTRPRAHYQLKAVNNDPRPARLAVMDASGQLPLLETGDLYLVGHGQVIEVRRGD